MSWLITIIQLAILIFKNIFERNAAKKELKKEAARMVSEGIKERDPAKITAGFDKVRQI